MRDTKKLVTLAMLSAMACIVMYFIRLEIIPAAPFLTYDPKDVIIVIGGFLFGPAAAAAISIVVAFIEMITISRTGFFGMFMNALSSISFACTAAVIYEYKRGISGAVIGLVAGCITTVSVMLLWNYIIVPMFMEGVTREFVAGMLITVFLPFNVLKTGLNGTIVLLLYMPLVTALRKAGLHETKTESSGKRINLGLMLVAWLTLFSIVLVILIMRGLISLPL